MLKWLVAMLFALASCCTFRDRVYTPSVINFQYATSTRIEVVCFDGAKMGSGVIISKRHIMTAKHVVTCKIGTPLLIYVTDWKGRKYPMVVDKHSQEHDISRLVAPLGEEPFNIYARIAFDERELGDTVCIVAGDSVVDMIRKCGEIAPGLEDMYITSIEGVPGNSGSALWSDSGEVIGITVKARWGEGQEHVLLAEKIDNVKHELLGDIYYLE